MVVPEIAATGASSSSGEEGVCTHDAEIGFDGSDKEKEKDLTLVSSVTLTPLDLA